MQQQKLQLKLVQKLSPQQIEILKLIQMPAIALEEKIKQEIDQNPALEFDYEEENINEEEQDEKNLENEFDNTNPIAVAESDISESDDSKNLNLEVEELNQYFFDDEPPDFYLSTTNTEQKSLPSVSEISLHDFLLQQFFLKDLTDKQKLIGKYVIGNLDVSGYLLRDAQSLADDLAILYNLKIENKEIEEVIEIIQELDPPGIGARNLQECLLIQLNRMPKDKSINNAILILKNYFNEFVNKHYQKILNKLKISEKELKEVIEVLQKLNPKPSLSIYEAHSKEKYVVPDFVITYDGENLLLSLESFNIPNLRINNSYKELLEHLLKKQKLTEKEKQMLDFLKQKIDSAKFFIEAIKQRHNTLYSTMSAIMNIQKEFFLTGDETLLKPMKLKDVAEIVNLDISTISRVVNSKYVQTPYGIFLLKYFFSKEIPSEDTKMVLDLEKSSIESDISSKATSSRAIKKIISDCIKNEDKLKPLTDEQLCKILTEKGYKIARRTIAKYREMLNIPVARLRKKII